MIPELVSIKIRVASGCFHREHSPNAYKIIDEYIRPRRSELLEHEDEYFRSRRSEFFGCEYEFREHESGPEIIAYIALTTAAIALATSIIDLIVTIIRARSEGIRRGDKPEAPLRLIVRSAYREEGAEERIVMEFSKTSEIKRAEIETNLNKAVIEILRKRKTKRAK